MFNFKSHLMRKVYLLFLVLGSMLASCESETESTSEVSSSINQKNLQSFYSYSEMVGIFQNRGELEFECKGECSCGMWIDYTTMRGECSCSPCALFLDFKDSRFIENRAKLQASLLNLEFTKEALLDLYEYSETKYGLKAEVFEKITFIITDELTNILFEFKDSNSVSRSVMYSHRLLAPTFKKFKVDCTGNCDCREQFDFNTNQAMCSCSDCQMIVEELVK